MEMFIRPFGDDARYMNFEINPAGAMVMGIHLNRREKTELILRYKCRVNPVPFSDSKNGSWGVVFTVPFAMQWPEHFLLVSIKRGQDEVIPDGNTLLTGGDYAVGLLPAEELDVITEKMSGICRTRI